jgi:hypothetical protein
MISRFVDRDMMMRYHNGLGVGHSYAERLHRDKMPDASEIDDEEVPSELEDNEDSSGPSDDEQSLCSDDIEESADGSPSSDSDCELDPGSGSDDSIENMYL